MSNEYKQTLARFEKAVRDLAWIGSKHPEEHAAIKREYEAAKRKLVGKLQYRQLAAELRNENANQK